MAQEPKYTPKKLEAGINDYFDSITKWEIVKEEVGTGKKDKFGHEIMKQVPAVNCKGEHVLALVYIVPPTISDLRTSLNISPTTWSRYANDEKYAEIVKRARGRVFDYLQKETLTRPDKFLGGILFNIKNNFPEYAEREDMEKREQQLRIAKMEAELEAMKDGSGIDSGVIFCDDL